MQLIDLFERLYRPARLVGRSPETSRLYRLSIKSFDKTVCHPSRIPDLTNDNLSLHMARVIDAGRSPATANKDRSQLLALWNFALRRKLTEVWPDVKPVPEIERIPTAWTPDEICRLIAAAARQEGEIAGVPAGRWWVALIYVALDTAERIGAVSQLKWSDIQGQWVIFAGGTRKGRRRDNACKLAEDTLVALTAIRDPIRREVFPWPYHPHYLWQKYGKILESAGLPADRRDKFHRLRRTTATLYDAAGHNAQRLLDHANPHVTRRYLDPRHTTKIQACDILAEILSNPRRRPPDDDSAKFPRSA